MRASSPYPAFVAEIHAPCYEPAPMGLKSGWDTPRLVAVETTNHCNAKCVFCPNNALARDKGSHGR